MDLLGGVGAPPASSQEPEAKVRVVGPTAAESSRQFTEVERELLRTVARQGLAHDQQVRLLKALIDSARVSTAGPIVTATKSAMDSLIRSQQTLRQEQSLDGPSIQERLGPAHVHIWNALVKCALQGAKDNSMEK